jgi:uncharacterized protein (DUF1697 family)
VSAPAEAHVALLRGINVGGHRKLPMADLRALLEHLGYGDVATYIQSGNAVFTTNAEEPVIVEAVSAAILARFGFEVPVIVRTRDELAAIAASHPFESAQAGRGETDETKLHVTFLAEAPDRVRLPGLDAATFAPDEVALDGRELYIHYAEGAGRSKLTTDAVERALGTSATARNWRTVRRLAEMLSTLE